MLNKIIELRKDARLSRKEASEKLGVSYSHISKIETGNRKPGRDLIEKMSEIYDCSIGDIYTFLRKGKY